METMSRVSRRHPQTAYVGLQKVFPVVVSFCLEIRPRCWVDLSPGLVGVTTFLPTGTFMWCDGQYLREMCDQPPGQTGRAGHSWSHSISLRVLYCIVCCPRTIFFRTPRMDIVTYRGSFPSLKGGPGWDLESQCAQCAGGTGGGHG